VLHEPDRKVTLADLKGAPFVLNVWGSWCPSCRDEHPVLTRFAETKRVRVVGFNWKDEPDDARRWLDQFGNPYWVVIADIEGKSAIDWGIYGAPETFLVGRERHDPLETRGSRSPDALIAGELVPAIDAIDPQHEGMPREGMKP
jgi:cytochrome c biogenesis protein CcmG/thiol:disulfide interchange protein DsbE